MRPTLRCPEPAIDQAALSALRYRYRVARLTPRYLAMFLAVWPSAFIRLAVETCSALATFRGRPNLVPLARDASRLTAVRSRHCSRSTSRCHF